MEEEDSVRSHSSPLAAPRPAGGWREGPLPLKPRGALLVLLRLPLAAGPFGRQLQPVLRAPPPLRLLPPAAADCSAARRRGLQCPAPRLKPRTTAT